ncbi:hypothetical protein [Rhodococcus phage REQ1]|uniref:hypothetical protein n=1 Tax=Rhodococcus phage REQ1 TaxID=1109712 RepID=UPI00023EEC52|nr:hypothetical protein RoPhREQ1_gp48 [Rhodococcus phage REQ1]AEV52044.1 hypothetical protein [Rhodococcus phage REQ1]
MGDYTPQHGTVRDFEEIQPHGDGAPAEIDDHVRIPGSNTEWVVTDVVGDFARLVSSDGSRTFAYRRTLLEPVP